MRKLLCILALLFTGGTHAAEPLAAPAPLLPESPAAPGEWLVRAERAGRALEGGFPATAAILYREVLGLTAIPDDARHRVTLELVTALLDSADIPAAEAALQAYTGPRHSGYQLRAGLLAAQARRFPAARQALAAIRAEELVPADVPWWHYLRALVADADNDLEERRQEYAEAERTAVSELQRVRFQLGRELAVLRAEQVSEQQLASLRGTMERFAGQPTGYEATRYYAAALNVAGRRAEALAVLQRALVVLPPSERSAADEFRLLLGFIGGESSDEGRRALLELVRQGLRPETQRIALQLLARGSRTPAARGRLRDDLTPLLDATPPHPLSEELLVTRASLALADNRYAAAEADARTLLERFPGSPMRAAALGVRLSVAWDERRFRAAADVIAQMRDLLEPGRERSELGVLLAETYFRSGDFRGAADAYESALREAPAVVPAGTLIFQRVLAEIRADRLDTAAALLDEAAANPALDAVSRWQAEWNLVKEMQVRGQATAALARVSRLLEEAAAGVPAELRIRLAWLQAKLSFDHGDPAEALRRADALLAALPGAAELPGPTRANVAGNTELLRAQALFALGRDEQGGAALERLRADHRDTPAAVYSYIVQAARLTQRGDMAQAQKVLTDLADRHPASEFAPLALYEAALNAERQGLDRNLQEANNLLERINRDFPRDPLRFYALLKQGDLLRRLNEFGAARQVYEFILNNQAQHPDVLLAQIALADTMFALGANNVVNYESAAALFERIRDLPHAPVDLRVEAGYKWGYALAKRDQAVRAVPVLWSVVDSFLLDPGPAAALGAKGRYWLSRTLLELGQLHEDAGRHAEAQRAYRLIVEQGLGGAAQARAKLERYRVAAPARP